MTMPTLIVEVGFTAALTGTALHLSDTVRGILGTNTLAAGDLLTDVTSFVTSVTTRRGATRTDGPTLRYEAGTCTINFRNDDRRFDPTNLSGPYVAGGVTQVEPLRAVRIRASYGGETWLLWRGFTDQWSVAYDGPDSSTASVTCFDAFGIFAAYDRNAVAAVGAGEDSGARINRILDSISWPTTDRMVDTGEETVQATTLADNVLTELLLTADTELGEFWVDVEGRARFRSRSASYTDFRSAYPQATFGDLTAAGDTTVNLITNPSCETGITGWTGGGFANPPTLSQSSTRAMFGTYSALATWANATSGDLPLIQYTVTGLAAGRTYTFSVYAYVPSGSPSVACVIATTGPWGSGTLDTVDQWVRLTLTTTVGSTSVQFQVWPKDSTTTAGQQVWLDGFQVEEGDTVTDYVDGAQAGCEWDGIAHESTSRRLPELPYADASLAYDALSITNTYSVARAGGTAQTATDSGSVSAYLTRSHTRSDLLMETDAEALMWAEQLLARTALPELRVAELQLKASRDPDRLWPQAFGREIGDRLRFIKRPPGGGDPIEREAWVRGVAHDLRADQDWTTALVLEQARDVTTITDTFSRTIASGWGSADTGEAWTTSGGSASDYSVSSGVGQHSNGTVNVLRTSLLTLGAVSSAVSVDITVPVVPTGGSITLWAVARADDLSNYYTARLTITTTGAASLALVKRVAGSLSGNLANFSLAGTHTAGTTWRIRLDVVGSTLRARAWRLGVDSDPGTWQVTTTDVALTTGTQVGVLSRLETGNTNTLPVVITFDSFSATTLYAWT